MNPAESNQPLAASSWGWAALVAASISVLGFALQTLLDYVPLPAGYKFAEFWGLFAGDAIVGFVAGVAAIVVGRRARRSDSTIAFGLIGIGWLCLAQGILLVWN
jgi:hypothetical protein